MQQMPEGVWFPSARVHSTWKQKANSFQVFQVKHQKLGPLCYLLGTLCADSWGEIFTRSMALCPSQQVKWWNPAAGGSFSLPYLQQMPWTSLCVTSLFLSFPRYKIVDPVYCKAELIPHWERLWDSGQETFIINTDKLLTSYTQPVKCWLWCQGGALTSQQNSNHPGARLALRLPFLCDWVGNILMDI